MTPKIKIPIKYKNDLKQFGYSVYASDHVRHRALTQAVREYGPLPVFRKLNALVIFNKNRHPLLSSMFKKDRTFIKKKFMTNTTTTTTYCPRCRRRRRTYFL